MATQTIQKRPAAYDGTSVLYLDDSYQQQSGRQVRIVGFREGLSTKLIEEGVVAQFDRELQELPLTDTDYCLDFSGIEWFGVAGIGKMIKFSQSYNRLRGVQLSVVNMKPEVKEVFEITRLDRIMFQFYATIDDMINEKRIPPSV